MFILLLELYSCTLLLKFSALPASFCEHESLLFYKLNRAFMSNYSSTNNSLNDFIVSSELVNEMFPSEKYKSKKQASKWSSKWVAIAAVGLTRRMC